MDLGLIKNLTGDGVIERHRIVAFAATEGSVKQATGPTDALIGVTGMNGSVAAGDRVDVMMDEIRDVEFGGAVSQGDPLTSDADGKAVLATAHTHSENADAAYTQDATTGTASVVRTIGYAMVDAVAGDIGPARIVPGNL